MRDELEDGNRCIPGRCVSGWLIYAHRGRVCFLFVVLPPCAKTHVSIPISVDEGKVVNNTNIGARLLPAAGRSRISPFFSSACERLTILERTCGRSSVSKVCGSTPSGVRRV